MAITKQKLKDLINYADFLSEEEKYNWLNFAENADNAFIKQAYKHFKDSIQKETDQKIVIMAKHGLTDKYQSSLKKYTKKFLQKYKNK